MKKTRVLFVLPSLLLRVMLERSFESNASIEVVASCSSVSDALNLINNTSIDLVVMEEKLPQIDPLLYLENSSRNRPPLLLIASSLDENTVHSIKALENGALDLIDKALLETDELIEANLAYLEMQFKKFASLSYQPRLPGKCKPILLNEPLVDRDVILLGASTGGVEAFCKILPAFPANSPGIVLAQRLPPVALKNFAERVRFHSSLRVRIATHGDIITPGTLYIVPTGRLAAHIDRRRGETYIKLKSSPPNHLEDHFIDALFTSASQCLEQKVAAVLMTGLGNDGVYGLKMLKDAGAATYAQDEMTSRAFEKPRQAHKNAASQKFISLESIPQSCLRT